MPKRELKPGEMSFIYLMIAFSFLVIYLSYDISGFVIFSQPAAPGTVPLITSLAMTVLAISMWREALKCFSPNTCETVKDKLRAMQQLLFTHQAVFMIALVMLYSVVLSRLGFRVATFIFLFIAMMYLKTSRIKWYRSWQQALRSIAFTVVIDLVGLALIIVLFAYVFKVPLPR